MNPPQRILVFKYPSGDRVKANSLKDKISKCNSMLHYKNSFSVFRNITSIDVSDVVIRQMSELNKGRPDLIFAKMDATEMEFQENQFSVVLDKGTLDALFTDDSPDVVSKIEKMFRLEPISDELSQILQI